MTARLFAVLADNPRQSELTNHRGAVGQNYCRFCFVRHGRFDLRLGVLYSMACLSLHLRIIFACVCVRVCVCVRRLQRKHQTRSSSSAGWRVHQNH